jgi:soluble lytic murein transglycosylase-like protein
MRVLSVAAFVTFVLFLVPPANAQAADANGNLDVLISKHSMTYNVPESLVRRIIKRESRGNPRVISKGNYGLMQIKLGTARGMGYTGTAAGLLDADTNMTYAVKYLANAYKVAGGNESRAVSLYAGGYYYAAKSKGMLADVDPNAGLGTVRGRQSVAIRTALATDESATAMRSVEKETIVSR